VNLLQEIRQDPRSTVLFCFRIRVKKRSSDRRNPQVPCVRLLTGRAAGRQRVKRLVRVSLEQ